MNTAGVVSLLNVTIPGPLRPAAKSAIPRAYLERLSVHMVFDADQIAALQQLITAAASNGWTWTQATLPSANWSLMASTPAGPNFRVPSSLVLEV